MISTRANTAALLPVLLLTIGMAVTVGSALGFEHIGGYIPCALCLLQRDPYYYGLGVGVAALAAIGLGAPRWLVRGLIAVLIVLMLVGAGMGVYHSGVEWGFWEGPSSCATGAQGVSNNVNDLLSDLDTKHGPSCTQAALRVLGLSFAGWNVIASLVLAAIGIHALRKA